MRKNGAELPGFIGPPFGPGVDTFGRCVDQRNERADGMNENVPEELAHQVQAAHDFVGPCEIAHECSRARREFFLPLVAGKHNRRPVAVLKL